ncbi:MptD family putative ECF transporter S component [Nonomuraea polychroma]|nr:MptD family putative ECF transporter S component [Nonomuraea polychroma]
MTTTAERRIDLRMSPKDLISVGVFGALYLVIVFGINMLGFINPAVMLIALAASIVAGGIPFILFLTRVRHAGMVTVFAIVTAGILMLSGHPPISFAISVVCALLAEAIIWAGNYRSRRLSVLAYAVYSAWYVGPMMPIFYARDDYFAGPSMQMMGPEYVSQMQALLSPGVLVLFDLSTVVFGLLGGLLGLRLMRKHFEKAGLA